LAWAIVAVSLIIAISPIITSRVKDHLNPSAHITVSPTPSPVATVAPQVDGLNALMATLVANLEKRTSAAEKKAEDLAEENGNLRQQLAKAEERAEHLNARVQVLTDRLMQRGQRDN
jgi:uncharacterized protein YlxW (UPF0749 family)